MRLLVCGTRQWSGSWEDIAEHLPDDMRAHGVTIIHGACSRKTSKRIGPQIIDDVEVSVDMLADFAARGLGFTVEPYPVDHSLDGPWPAAGPRRNARMLYRGKPTHGLAFGSLWKRELSRIQGVHMRSKRTGTGDMVSRMITVGLPVRWVPAPGEPAQDLTAMPAPPRGGA